MVRTRFAPSPTGLLHVGNLRTALFNALFAAREGGRLLLRFDDTDRERSAERFVAAIREDLAWVGLRWDEEMRQSARLDAYAAAAERLKAAGRLYPAWDTAEELELRRRAQRAAGRPPVYDRRALGLSEAEKARLAAEGRRPHWRFRLEDRAVGWDDLIVGPVSVEAGSLSDPVLIREDGTPLYAFASVVDDADTAISHVIRGADHVTNTAVQIQLFEALEAAPPRFAHHSLLTAPGGAAFSKRDGALSVAALREEGIEPEALTGMLARLGSGADPAPMTVAEAAAGFDPGAFGAAPVAFDPAQLRRLSAQVVRGLPYAAVKARLAAVGADDPALWEAVRPNLERVAEAADWARLAAEGPGPVDHGADADFVAQALAMLPQRPWGEGTWRDWTEAVKAATGRKGAALYRPLRRALTGRDHGPDMAALTPLLRGPAAKA